MKKKNHVFGKVIWIWAGIIFGLIIALMNVSGSTSFNRFYDGGKVYDVTLSNREGNASGMEYRSFDGRFEVTEETACKYCPLSDMEEAWNYIIIELSSFTQEYIDAEVEYYNITGEIVDTQEVRLSEGKNIVQTNGVVYSGINIWINHQKGAAFSIDKMQFREKLVEFDGGRFALVFGLALLLYMAVSFIIYMLCRCFRIKMPDWYGAVDFLQGFYLIVGERLGQKVMRIGGRNRSRMRVGLFLFLILYMQAVMDLQLYETDKYYKLQMLVCSLAVTAIGILCYEKKLVRLNWRNKLVWSWLVLWLLACVSDVFVAKRYSFAGYLMLFVIGFFIFMWNNMERKERIFREFLSAIIISFVITTVFCFLCRPLVEGARYLGTYFSPGMYAMYLLFVWIALWGDIDYKIGKVKMSPIVFVEAAGAILAGLLLWKTQSSSGVIPAFLVFVLFVFKHVSLSKSVGKKKRMFVILAAAAIMAAPVCKTAEWGLVHLSGILGTEVNFQKDEYFSTSQTLFEPVQVYAAEANEGGQEEGGLTDSRIIKKLFANRSLESFTSARNLYWIGYLREMNLLGHENKVKLWGSNRWPHNGFIAMMYRYGIFSVIPYTIMVFLNIAYSWKYMRKHKNGYGYFLFASMIAAFILILMENLELPFLYLCWYAMYLMMGVNFIQEESK